VGSKSQLCRTEQRRKNGIVDHKADIYALGLILNEMFTRELALSPDHKRIAAVAPRYAHLDRLVSKMLSKTPANRPSIATILKALSREPPTTPKRSAKRAVRSISSSKSEVSDRAVNR
jgi:serine/threonine protein kinase